MNFAQMLQRLSDDELVAFAAYEQGRANELQSKARKAQSEADRARKEIKKRRAG